MIASANLISVDVVPLDSPKRSAVLVMDHPPRSGLVDANPWILICMSLKFFFKVISFA